MVGRTCAYLMPGGRLCRATPLRDEPYCFWHAPETAEEAAEARRFGGLHRRKKQAERLGRRGRACAESSSPGRPGPSPTSSPPAPSSTRWAISRSGCAHSSRRWPSGRTKSATSSRTGRRDPRPPPISGRDVAHPNAAGPALACRDACPWQFRGLCGGTARRPGRGRPALPPLLGGRTGSQGRLAQPAPGADRPGHREEPARDGLPLLPRSAHQRDRPTNCWPRSRSTRRSRPATWRPWPALRQISEART